MSPPRTTVRRAGVRAIACAALCAGVLPASAGAATISSNWAGYVALRAPSSGADFSSVSGTWVQPGATCAAGHESYSAVWVGLGGYSESANALEQIGTDADCARSGTAIYDVWYELLPAGPVAVPLQARPGDMVAASVTVRGRDATLRIRDLTTGARFSHTQRVASIDASSADWIVEAPSLCFTHGCRTLPLANFGTAAFTSATATAQGHTGAVADALWSSGPLELRQSTFSSKLVRGGESAGQQQAHATNGVIAASPTAPSPAGAFSVSWREQQIAATEPQRPVLPGFGGGPP